VFDSTGEYYSPQLLRRGILLPEISVDQLVYTLGKWMGVADADLLGTGTKQGIAPNLNNFPVEDHNIGFFV
jgi:hypothetical protein